MTALAKNINPTKGNLRHRRASTRRGRIGLVMLTFAYSMGSMAFSYMMYVGERFSEVDDRIEFLAFVVNMSIIVVGAPLGKLLWESLDGVLGIPKRALDERQTNIRMRIYAISYWLIVPIVIVFGVLLALNTGRKQGIVGLMGIDTILLMPAMVAAWILPDDIVDDEPTSLRTETE